MFKKWNLFILLGIIIILISVIFFIYLQNKPQTPPKMVLSEVEWDFGVVKPNEKPAKVITIKNEGDEDLLIERVRASCGCVKTSISTKRIKSGKSADLTITFDTTGYDGKVK